MVVYQLCVEFFPILCLCTYNAIRRVVFTLILASLSTVIDLIRHRRIGRLSRLLERNILPFSWLLSVRSFFLVSSRPPFQHIAIFLKIPQVIAPAFATHSYLGTATWTS
jgi:hypothetical protein